MDITGVASVATVLEERDMKEINEYFTALERDLDHQKQLLKEQEEQHHLELSAVERQHIQERMVWEREWREREEAILSTIKAMAVSRERLMADIRSYYVPLVSIKHLGEQGIPGKLWMHSKSQATPDAATQNAHSSSGSSASKQKKEKEFNMQDLIKLEKRVRKAEAKKMLKVQRKAEKKTKKAEKRLAKEAKKMEKRDGGARDAQTRRFWHILSMGCATSVSHD